MLIAPAPLRPVPAPASSRPVALPPHTDYASMTDEQVPTHPHPCLLRAAHVERAYQVGPSCRQVLSALLSGLLKDHELEKKLRPDYTRYRPPRFPSTSHSARPPSPSPLLTPPVPPFL